MLNPLNFLSKFIKSSNQKELDRIAKIVTEINILEDSTKNLNDSDFVQFQNHFLKSKYCETHIRCDRFFLHL